MSYPKAEGTLYNPRFEHDSCGVGFVADISGEKSRRVLDRALEAVVNVTHRGAVSADAKTGDGPGVLTQIPSSIFVPQAAALGATVANDGDLAVGVVFLPQDGAAQARRTLKGALHDCGLTVLGWRETPIDASIIGDQALAHAAAHRARARHVAGRPQQRGVYEPALPRAQDRGAPAGG